MAPLYKGKGVSNYRQFNKSVMKKLLAAVWMFLASSASWGQIFNFELRLENPRGDVYTLNRDHTSMTLESGPEHELEFSTPWGMTLRFSTGESGPVLEKGVVYEGILSAGDPGFSTHVSLNEPWSYVGPVVNGETTFKFSELERGEDPSFRVEFKTYRTESEWLRGEFSYGTIAVPEPETYAIVAGIGLLTFGVVRRCFQN